MNLQYITGNNAMNLDNKQEDLNSKKNRPLGCMTIVSGLGCGCLTAIIGLLSIPVGYFISTTSLITDASVKKIVGGIVGCLGLYGLCYLVWYIHGGPVDRASS